jgi:hypothetical protein
MRQLTASTVESAREAARRVVIARGSPLVNWLQTVGAASLSFEAFEAFAPWDSPAHLRHLTG